MLIEAWNTLYRWEWFRRDQWRPFFREQKAGDWGGSAKAFLNILESIDGKCTLDASCGLGLKTIVMNGMGIDIEGCDGSDYAIKRASELARIEGVDIPYFTSAWSDLANNAPQEYDAIYNDALTWILTKEEFSHSLREFKAILNPGGALVFGGVRKGSLEGRGVEVLDEVWESSAKFRMEWAHERNGVKCASILIRERGPDYVDAHHVFHIEEDDAHRIETASIRQPAYWDWPVIEEMILDSGFTSVETREFTGMGQGGRTFTLNVAIK